jgi:hypothetical protein
MSEKVTLRFEQFSEGNEIISTGPVHIYQTVNSVADLESVYVPEMLLNEDNEGDFNKYSIVVFVKNVNNPSAPIGSLRYRGEYYFYDYTTDSWHPIVIGTHTHENKDFIDRLGAFDFGDEVIGTRRFLTLEVIDTDDTNLTYEYDLQWRDLPKDLPAVPLNPPQSKDSLYLGLDTTGDPTWKNSFIAAQTFQIKKKEIIEDGNQTIFNDVFYNENTDEILLIENSVFIQDREITYSSESRTMTIDLPNDTFSEGSSVTLLIIRNGATAILEEMAKDYLTKEEAVSILSGGSINLKNYAKKTDLYTRAAKEHTHSQFSREGHDHDWQYAPYQHTHGQYTTRSKVIELIQEALGLHPDILDLIVDFNNYFEGQAGNPIFQDFLQSLATVSDIDIINQKLIDIEENYYTKSQIHSYLDNRKFESYQIDTEFIDPSNSSRKDLNQVLQEMKDQIEVDYETTEASKLFVDEDIYVMLAEGENQGKYKNGGKIVEGSSLLEVLTNLVQRIVPPIYTFPIYETNFNLVSYPELGSNIPVEIESIYQQNDGGPVRMLDIRINEQVDIRYTFDTSIIKNITITNEPITIKARVEFDDGITKTDNFGNPYVIGKVYRAWSPYNTFSLMGYRAIFFGSTITEPVLTSGYIRNNLEREVFPDYDTIDISIELPKGSKYILFALPESSGNLEKIIYNEQGIDIIDEFNINNIMIADASQYSNHAEYMMYSFELLKPTTETMTIRFIK